jgi:hypothetical protein
VETHVSPDTIINELLEQNKQLNLQVIVLRLALAQLQAESNEDDND